MVDTLKNIINIFLLLKLQFKAMLKFIYIK